MKIFTKVILAILCLSSTLLAQNQPITKYLRLKIPADGGQMERLAELGVAADHAEMVGRHFIIEVNNLEYDWLKNEVQHEILVADLEAHYAQQLLANEATEIHEHGAGDRFPCTYTTPALFNTGSMGGYLTLTEMLAELDQMAASYPNLITVKQALSPTATTHEGRQIFYVKISDNPNLDELEPEVLYTSLHHAREPMSMMSTIFYMHYLLQNYASNTDIQNLVNATEMFFVPCLNPDGYVFNQSSNPGGGGMWRKNRRNNGNNVYGVDLNRNYAYQWGAGTGSSSTPSAETYRGPSAFSEPETQMLRDFCINRNFVTAFNAHSYSNVLIYPWGYVNSCPDLATYQPMADDLTTCNNYNYGTCFQTINYLASGTSDDWMFGEQTTKPKIYAMTPEIGSSTQGFWPPSTAIVNLCNAMMFANLRLAEYASIHACTGFTVNAGNDVTICAGNSTTLSAGGSNGNTPYTFVWSNGVTTASQTVNPSNTSVYTLTLTDANGCTSTDAVTVTVNNCNTPCGINPSVMVNTNGFELNYGIWIDPGVDCARELGNANTGLRSLRLRDNTTTSLGTTQNLNLTPYHSVAVQFSFITVGFDTNLEDFWLQISTDGGTTFTTIEEWNLNDEFVNGVRHDETAFIDGPFTANTRLRFRCDASDDTDNLYLDDVVITGCLPLISVNENPAELVVFNGEKAARAGDLLVYPNPVRDVLNVRFALATLPLVTAPLPTEGGVFSGETDLQIIDIFGRSIYHKSLNTNELEAGFVEIYLKENLFPSGIYFLKIGEGLFGKFEVF